MIWIRFEKIMVKVRRQSSDSSDRSLGLYRETVTEMSPQNVHYRANLYACSKFFANQIQHSP